MRSDRLALKYPRAQRRELTLKFAGSHYSETGIDYTRPVNILALYTQIVGRNLIAKNPRTLLSTMDVRQKPAVLAMQDWVNQKIVEMNLEGVLKRNVTDALFSIGITKVALATPSDAAFVAWKLQAGQPFASNVDLDDFVCDMHARDFDELGYVGHRYRVPLETVRDSKLYNKRRKELVASPDPLYNPEGDTRISEIGRTTYGSNQEEFEDMVDLWEIYLPRHRLVLTLEDTMYAGASLDAEPLRVQKWIGPDRGPYHFCTYEIVPGNLMPIGPLQRVVDLDDAINNIYRKLIEQARRQKQVLPIRSGATDDGKRIIEANDGEAIRVDNDNPAAVDYGGPSQVNMQLGIHLKDMAMMLAGNLEMMGGLAPQSKTLGQDQMLQQNASGQVSEMQKQTVDHAASVIESLCWYYWHHPTNVMSVPHQAPGIPEITVMRHVHPQHRQGTMPKVQVDPYSMQHSTPQTKLAALTQVVQQMMPMMQLLQQQGIMFDMETYLKKIASYLDLPDLPEIFTIQEPPQQTGQGAQSQEGPGMLQAPQGGKESVRRSVGGDTAANRNAAYVNSAMGGAPQTQRNGKVGAA